MRSRWACQFRNTRFRIPFSSTFARARSFRFHGMTENNSGRGNGQRHCHRNGSYLKWPEGPEALSGLSAREFEGRVQLEWNENGEHTGFEVPCPMESGRKAQRSRASYAIRSRACRWSHSLYHVRALELRRLQPGRIQGDRFDAQIQARRLCRRSLTLGWEAADGNHFCRG
jgi:hypothetical protein